jgi:hypothetical protein
MFFADGLTMLPIPIGFPSDPRTRNSRIETLMCDPSFAIYS